MYFYEIHEGDDDLGSAVLLGHQERWAPLAFFAMVKRARTLLLDAFEEDSLAEAIANELERSGGFVHVTDDRLVAAVAVGATDEETYLVTEDEHDRAVYVSQDDDEPPLA